MKPAFSHLLLFLLVALRNSGAHFFLLLLSPPPPTAPFPTCVSVSSHFFPARSNLQSARDQQKEKRKKKPR